VRFLSFLLCFLPIVRSKVKKISGNATDFDESPAMRCCYYLTIPRRLATRTNPGCARSRSGAFALTRSHFVCHVTADRTRQVLRLSFVRQEVLGRLHAHAPSPQGAQLPVAARTLPFQVSLEQVSRSFRHGRRKGEEGFGSPWEFWNLTFSY